MQFRISDTFTDSLARLTGDEQKAVKTTAFDLQLNPANPGMQFHKLDRAKDANFWSVRVSRDLRAIVHKTSDSLLLCYVAHHDDAYHWAERRKLERHPTTGAAQLVEVREMVREITVPVYVTETKPAPPKPPLLAGNTDEDLLAYGVPPEWLADVHAATEDTILELADHLPREAAEAILDLATGGRPKPAPATPESADPFTHPDAQSRFQEISDKDELERALNYPWDKWMVFLHPSQRQLVEKDFNGPARVAGSAGTGKTIVALHRAVCLARQNFESRVLLTTFSEALASALQWRLRRFIEHEPRLLERIEVHALSTIGHRIGRAKLGPIRIATSETIQTLLAEAAQGVTESRFTPRFLLDEWTNVVDAWQIESWDAYRDVRRIGRKTRLTEPQRQMLWGIFEQVRSRLVEQGLQTEAGMYASIAAKLNSESRHPFDFVVVDEAQDIAVPELVFVAALGAGRPNGLFFAGDLGQRIFQQPFSWKSLGVDIRGRSHILKINYRTSHQIRQQADRLLPPELTDMDGNTESRRGAVSVFNGEQPVIRSCADEADETDTVAEWLKALVAEGFQPREIGLFVRSADLFPRALAAVDRAGLQANEVSDKVESGPEQVMVSTMHLAKGLEFRAVAVMACDDEIIPSQTRIETIGDQADLEDVYETERHLLYVACTRARDRLLVTGIDPSSEFLEDLSLSSHTLGTQS